MCAVAEVLWFLLLLNSSRCVLDLLTVHSFIISLAACALEMRGRILGSSLALSSLVWLFQTLLSPAYSRAEKVRVLCHSHFDPVVSTCTARHLPVLTFFPLPPFSFNMHRPYKLPFFFHLSRLTSHSFAKNPQIQKKIS